MQSLIPFPIPYFCDDTTWSKKASSKSSWLLPHIPSNYQLLLKHKDFLEKQMVHEKSW